MELDDRIKEVERRIISRQNALNSIEELISTINELIEQDQQFLKELKSDRAMVRAIGLPGYSK